MSLRAYVKSRAWEFVLVLACVWALSVVAMGGFWVESGLQHGPIPLLAVFVLLCGLYLAAWRRESLVPGIVTTVVLCAVVVGASIAFSTGDDPWKDSVENYFMAALCVVFSAVCGFALTRTLAGSAVWFVACVFTCSFVEAAFRSGELAFSLVVLVASLSLVVWRNCSLAQMNADTLRRVSRTANLGTALLPVIGTAALASIVWFGIIAPLNPGELKLELIVDYRTEQIVHVRGAGNVRPEVNMDLKSNNLVDGKKWTTDDLKVSEDAEKTVEAKSVPEQQLQAANAGASKGKQTGGSSSGSRDTLDKNDTQQRWNQVSYSLLFPMIIVLIVALLLAIAAIIALFVWRRRMRRKRLEGWLARGRRSSVMSIYLFLTEKLAKLGFKVPPGMTIAEWAHGSERSMEGLREQTHVPFSELTATYAKVAYGGYVPTEEEVVPFVTWYLWFWKAARAHLGNFRYFFKSFRLG